MFFKILIQFLLFFVLSLPVFAEIEIDQWKDSDKTYYDLIQEGFEVKAYNISNIKTKIDYTFMFFVTVLQKNKQVYECQEYQTLDINMQTLDMNFICRRLVQPYKRGIGT